MNNNFNFSDEYFRSLQRIQNTIEQYNKSMLNNMSSQMMEAMNTYYDQIYQNNNLSKIMTEISNNVSKRFVKNFNKLIQIEQNLNRINKIATSNFASDKIINSIVSLRSSIDVYDPPNLLIEQSLKLPVAYQTFVKNQYNYAEKNELISKRAIKVANEAGNFVLNQQISSEISMEMLNEIDHEENEKEELVFASSETNIFPMLNQHISNVYRKDREPNIIKSITNSIPAQINQYGYSLIELIYKINRSYQFEKGSYIFKPTVKSMYASSLLSSHIATNEDDFAKIVDHLYFMIYEGSGNAKRLTNIATDEELEALWYLKHLRLNFRHDVEHGSNMDKKLLKGGNAFDYLISKPMPIKVSDWKKAQLSLYKKITNMLNIIIFNKE